MAHTPSQPADDRPLKILERADVPEDHKQRLLHLARVAQQAAADAGTADQLQCEFGREAVAFIHDCDQFLRLYRGGPSVGRMEVLVPDDVKEELRGSGLELADPEGFVFRRFGWVSIDPCGDVGPLEAAVRAAHAHARRRKTD